MIHITKSYILESIRNAGVFFGNIVTPFVFILCSWGCSLAIKDSPETLDYMIKGQFLPISIMLLIFAFAFSLTTVYLADLRANNTLHWLKRTNILPATYFIGMGFGVFLLMNVALILMLIGYALLISISLKAIISIIVICNFVLLAMYPLCFIIAGVVKNGKTAQSLLTPIMLIFMFSITMPSMFLTLNDKQPQDYYSFLAWNPMLYLTDTLQVQLELHSQTWLPIYQYVIILSVICTCLAVFAKKLYR
ncbi:ABC transporter permease [Solibacillus sp. MA9]|uniref:ABC transporter permease n=1 Tax=Solibacillus palustris TaxID=2908203 RepID=A0ABS9UC34_9BACL|nr:ABC transporter permease [Solibacillus sp. MA9]MCH7321907.1 ABC transporter permease [Solibacillus sp. MA9]